MYGPLPCKLLFSPILKHKVITNMETSKTYTILFFILFVDVTFKYDRGLKEVFEFLFESGLKSPYRL